MFGRRPDASPVRDVSPMRAFMPFVSPRRNESLVYFAQPVDVEAALAFAAERSRERPADRPLTLFHLFVFAMARMLHERPRLNRFIAGGRLWQRDGVHVSFAAKARFDDDAPLFTIKRRIDVPAGLDAMVDGIYEKLGSGRRGRKSTSDREVEWLLRLPPPLVRGAMALVDGADALGLLPRSMIDADPLFCSAFLANLGSVGLDAGYHHLWERGNCPIFGVLGRVTPGPEGRRVAMLKFTYDERIEDGLYCARSLEAMRGWLEKPERLLDG